MDESPAEGRELSSLIQQFLEKEGPFADRLELFDFLKPKVSFHKIFL